MKELARLTRSYRRFKEEKPLEMAVLRDLVDIARLSANHRNEQPLKYLLSADTLTNSRIFPSLRWAAGLKDWIGPSAGERPSAYILILGDSSIASDTGQDQGIAAQTIALAAAEQGLGSCMIGAIDRSQLASELALPQALKILLVVALGYPGENVIIDEMDPGADYRYYRDSSDNHHVPKRSLEEVIFTVPGAGASVKPE